jgi:RES domain-containing protein
MIVYRLATALYKEDLSGTGAKLFGGRWNSAGIPALYTTENISLAVLEILVRADKHTIPDSYHLIKINIPSNLTPAAISLQKLKKGWKDDIGYTQWMGDEFIKSNEGIILKVPSAIVAEENNYLLNTNHKDFQKVRIQQVSAFRFDKRLFLEDE